MWLHCEINLQSFIVHLYVCVCKCPCTQKLCKSINYWKWKHISIVAKCSHNQQPYFRHSSVIPDYRSVMTDGRRLVRPVWLCIFPFQFSSSIGCWGKLEAIQKQIFTLISIILRKHYTCYERMTQGGVISRALPQARRASYIIQPFLMHPSRAEECSGTHTIRVWRSCTKLAK